MQTLLYKGQIRSCHKIVISYQDFLILDVWIVWPVTSPWAGAWGCRSRRPRWPSARPGHCRTAPAPGQALQARLIIHLDTLSFSALIMCGNCTKLVLRNVWSWLQVYEIPILTVCLLLPASRPPAPARPSGCWWMLTQLALRSSAASASTSLHHSTDHEDTWGSRGRGHLHDVGVAPGHHPAPRPRPWQLRPPLRWNSTVSTVH